MMAPAKSERFTISIFDERLAVCRLDPGSEIPSWAGEGGFSSATRTPDELSIVCPESSVPPEIAREPVWRALELEGPFDLGLTGVLASILSPLAQASVSVFVISTHDTDYVLVRETQLERTTRELSERGHIVNT